MIWYITPEELLERYASGERNFAGIELVEYVSSPKYRGGIINLDGMVLRDINLRGAYFNQVYLMGADLTGADMGGIFLTDCALSEAVIRDASLRAATVYATSFTDADLRESNLDWINASGCSFRGAYIRSLECAILANTDFKGAHTESGLICRGMNLIWRTTMPNGNVVEGLQ
jgi:uncharacterized protein YjbI with pentapeptide repeats